MLGVGARLGLALRDVLLANRYGAGVEIDAFAIAQAIPLFLVVTSAAAMTAAIVPRLVGLLEDGKEARAEELLVRMVVVTILVSAGLAAAVVLLKGPILAVLGSGFSPGTRADAESLLLISAPMIFIGGLLAVLSAGLHAQHRFRSAAAAPAGNMVVVLGWLALSGGAGGVRGVAAISIVGSLVELAVVVTALRRSVLRLRLRWLAIDDDVRRILAQALPLIGSSVVMASTPLVDQAIAAAQAPGSVARVAFGTKLVSFVVGSIAMALSTTMLPAFSRLAAQKNVAALRTMLRTWLVAIGIGGTCMAVLFALLSRPLVSLAFERGSFTAADAASVATIQAVAVFQLPFYLVGIIAVRLLSATGRNRSLLGITVVSAVVNVVADLVFVRIFGLPGIALATVCVYASSSTLSWILVRKALRTLGAQDAGTVVTPCSPVGAPP